MSHPDRPSTRVSKRALLLAAAIVIIALLVVLLVDRCSVGTTSAGPGTGGPTADAPGSTTTPRSGLATVAASVLPVEARTTLALIDKGGPFPYAQDNTVFGNFEGLLPARPSGYYHEYTVPTPGLRNRGTRRLVVGQRGDTYYTGDHYETFRQVLR